MDTTAFEQLQRHVQHLKDRQEIQDCVHRHARGHDRFDVDLLGRLLYPEMPNTPPCPADRWLEVPLRAWRDASGSKVTLAAMFGMGWDLLGICFALRRRRASTAICRGART